MTPQTSGTSIAAENAPKVSILSLPAGHFISGGFSSEECESISDGYFKMLMALVAVATFAFGCIVNGWLL